VQSVTEEFLPSGEPFPVQGLIYMRHITLFGQRVEYCTGPITLSAIVRGTCGDMDTDIITSSSSSSAPIVDLVDIRWDPWRHLDGRFSQTESAYSGGVCKFRGYYLLQPWSLAPTLGGGAGQKYAAFSLIWLLTQRYAGQDGSSPNGNHDALQTSAADGDAHAQRDLGCDFFYLGRFCGAAPRQISFPILDGPFGWFGVWHCWGTRSMSIPLWVGRHVLWIAAIGASIYLWLKKAQRLYGLGPTREVAGLGMAFRGDLVVDASFSLVFFILDCRQKSLGSRREYGYHFSKLLRKIRGAEEHRHHGKALCFFWVMGRDAPLAMTLSKSI